MSELKSSDSVEPMIAEKYDQKTLILTLYKCAISFSQQAREAILQGDLKAKGYAIQRAYDCIAELRKSLDMEKGGEIAEGLNKLYAFLGHQLTLANLNNDADILESVITVLSDLSQTWEQAFDAVEATPPDETQPDSV